MAAQNSLLNTPPVFAMYVIGLVSQYLLAQGGLPTMAAYNAEKARLLYQVLDTSAGFYRGCPSPRAVRK